MFSTAPKLIDHRRPTQLCHPEPSVPHRSRKHLAKDLCILPTSRRTGRPRVSVTLEPDVFHSPKVHRSQTPPPNSVILTPEFPTAAQSTSRRTHAFCPHHDEPAGQEWASLSSPM